MTSYLSTINLDSVYQTSKDKTAWHVLGALAGLLVVRIEGCDKSVVEAMPESLKPMAWKKIEKNYAESVSEALSVMASYGASLRYSSCVAPQILSSKAHIDQSVFERLLACVSQIDCGTCSGRDFAARLFDDALRILAKNIKGVEEHVTSDRVANLMVELASPEPGESIYDPCFGFGELLVRTARSLSRDKVGDATIAGIEANRLSYSVGLCRALLAGANRPRLEKDDAISGSSSPPKNVNDGFDCIMADPPWGSVGERKARLFLKHVMDKLRPGGRAVVALPKRMLSPSEKDPARGVRKELLWSKGYVVEAVVTLPTGAFGVNVPGSIVVFRRPAPPPVRFITVSTEGWRERKHRLGAVISERRELPSGNVSIARGVRAWDVPVHLLPPVAGLSVEASGRLELHAMLDQIRAANPGLQIASLRTIAKVQKGISYEDRFTTTNANERKVVGLLNVSDIASHQMRTPSLFLTEEGQRKLPEGDIDRAADLILRPRDIVVVTSGKIGEVGFVSDLSDVGSAWVNKYMAIVRVNERVNPRYLAALLRSSAYQSWMQSEGVALSSNPTRHLKAEALRLLKVPVPSDIEQELVLDALEGVGGDALAALGRVLSRGGEDPLAIWLERPDVARIASGSVYHGTTGLAIAAEQLLDASFESVLTTNESTSHSDSDKKTIVWARVVRQAALSLRDVVSVPRGAGLLAILTSVQLQCHESMRALDGNDSSIVDRLRSFTASMIDQSAEAIASIQQDVVIEIAADSVEVDFRIHSEVRLRLTNSSALPVRALRVTTKPDVGAGTISYLIDGESADVPLTIRPRKTSAGLRIGITWQALRIDGSPVQGNGMVHLVNRPDGESLRLGDLGASPYIVGSPVDRKEMFFGRADIMDVIRRQFGARTHANVVLLEGNRRTGKTSILRQIEKSRILGSDWIPVYCSLQDTSNMATGSVFRLLARTIGLTLYRVGVDGWDSALEIDGKKPFQLAFIDALKELFKQGDSYDIFRQFLSEAIDAAHRNHSGSRILLMLDEFDKLQEGIDGGITSAQVPQNLRHLLQEHQSGLGAIITGSRRLKRLREEYWSALFGLGYRVGVSALSSEAACRLVTDPVTGRLRYLPQARDRLVHLCARQPFLIQSLCNRVFDRGGHGDGTITVDIVDEAAAEMVHDNEHFRTLWDYARTERKRLVTMVCYRLSRGSLPVDINQINVQIVGYGVPVRSTRHLLDDLTELCELEILDFDGRGGYRISVPLMARWLQNMNIEDVVAGAKQEGMEGRS